MKIDRKVTARKNQYLVALPAEVRHHLGLVAGARVWWHVGRKGLATLTASGQLRAGRPRFEEECRSCAKYRAEVERLRLELRDGEQATAGQLVREGFEQAVATYGKVADRLDGQREMLRDVRAMLRELVKAGALRPGRTDEPPIGQRLARVMVDAAPRHDQGDDESDPAPSPSPSPASVEEGAATSGAQLPGGPLES